VKFIFADSLDYVDPNYDFIKDTHAPKRQVYWDDEFPHEALGYAPYDGMLVSRATVGNSKNKGHYTESQQMRFHRVGAREFLRFNKPEHESKMLMGDCGAFSYSKEPEPPYTAFDTIEFYSDGRFSHGCSVDHIIFEYNANGKGLKDGSQESLKRYEITLQLASEFIVESKVLGESFTPIGVVQGWSPDSLAHAATSLVKMGYQYLAIGGLVPLKIPEIHSAVTAVHDAVSAYPNIKIHLLGFAKAESLHEFTKYEKIASFDSSSPMLKAFKDSKNNYFLPRDKQGLNYYTALRIPQAIQNRTLKTLCKQGRYSQEQLLEMESRALTELRSVAENNTKSIDDALDALITYTRPLNSPSTASESSITNKLHSYRLKYKRVLEDRPWEKCNCKICTEVGVEALIFRASNRNKRRGMHNLHVYYQHLKQNISP